MPGSQVTELHRSPSGHAQCHKHKDAQCTTATVSHSCIDSGVMARLCCSPALVLHVDPVMLPASSFLLLSTQLTPTVSLTAPQLSTECNDTHTNWYELVPDLVP